MPPHDDPRFGEECDLLVEGMLPRTDDRESALGERLLETRFVGDRSPRGVAAGNVEAPVRRRGSFPDDPIPHPADRPRGRVPRWAGEARDEESVDDDVPRVEKEDALLGDPDPLERSPRVSAEGAREEDRDLVELGDRRESGETGERIEDPVVVAVPPVHRDCRVAPGEALLAREVEALRVPLATELEVARHRVAVEGPPLPHHEEDVGHDPPLGDAGDEARVRAVLEAGLDLGDTCEEGVDIPAVETGRRAVQELSAVDGNEEALGMLAESVGDRGRLGEVLREGGHAGSEAEGA